MISLQEKENILLTVLIRILKNIIKSQMTSAPSLNCMRQPIKMHFLLHFTSAKIFVYSTFDTPLFARPVSR